MIASRFKGRATRKGAGKKMTELMPTDLGFSTKQTDVGQNDDNLKGSLSFKF
jgi:hypothetical protein